MNVGPDRTGNAMGDFLLGNMTQIRQAMPGLLSPVQHYVGVYAQDTWRTTPRLTLNYGVRWEPFLPFRWVPSGATGGVRVYNFSVDDFKAGKKSVVFPTAPAGLQLSEPERGRIGPGRLRRRVGDQAAAGPVRAARRRGVRSDRIGPDARSAPATASPTSWSS